MGLKWITGGRVKPRTLQHEQARPHAAMTLRCWKPTPGALLQALTPAHCHSFSAHGPTPMDGGVGGMGYSLASQT